MTLNVLGNEFQRFIRYFWSYGLRLLFKNGKTSLVAWKLNLLNHSPFEAGYETGLYTWKILWSHIARHHYLLALLMKSIESIEELFLEVLSLAHELYVINQKYVYLTVPVSELLNRIARKGIDVFIHEPFCGQIANCSHRILSLDLISYGLHYVSFAETGAAMYEQRVVALLAWLLRYTSSSSVNIAVRRANYKFIERIILYKRHCRLEICR